MHVRRDRDSTPYDLGELLATPDLGLELLTGDERVNGRRISGAHCIEVDSPTRWMTRDWLMLTTGWRLQDRPDEQRSLIRELDSAGISALGFAVEMVFADVPAAMLEEAGALGFPIFAVPLPTAFRDVVSAISGALLSNELRSMQRLASIQRYLIDGLKEAEPRGAVVERTARVIGVAVTVIPPRGDPWAHEIGPSSQGLAAALDEVPPVACEIEVGPWHVVAVPIEPSSEGAGGWMAASSRRPNFVNTLTKQILQSAVPLITAANRLQATARRQERASRAALLEEILVADEDPQRTHSLAARAATIGVDFAEAAQIVTIGSLPPPGPNISTVLKELDHAAGEARLKTITTVEDEGVVALVQGSAEQVSTVITDLVEKLGLQASLGRPFSSVEGAATSLADARLVAETPASSDRRSVLAYEDLDLGYLLVRELPRDRLGERLERIISVLEANPPLHQALDAYFRSHLDVARAAGSLHLHPNSLRYRIQRVEALLDCSLKDPAAIASLHVALTAARESSQLSDNDAAAGPAV